MDGHSLKLFRTRLALLMLLLAVPALALILYSNLDERRIETAGVRQEAIALSRLAAAREENLINNTRQLLATLSQISFLVQSTNRAICELHFSNLRRLLPDYRRTSRRSAPSPVLWALTSQACRASTRPRAEIRKYSATSNTASPSSAGQSRRRCMRMSAIRSI